MENDLTQPTTPGQLSRRNFLKLGLGALGAAALVELGGVGFLYLQPRETADAFGKIIQAGPVESFPAGSVTEFRNGRFFLVRGQSGGFLAIYRRCPHLGCNVNWLPEENHFHCPCHAARFDEFGDLESPPVPRPLDTFPVVIKEGQVIVDTSQRQQREQFAPDQLAYAA
ncbi:MAG: Rieske (2Fe-2S) protein [Chloroflexi bacterium]|nr:Rieske (2Fe-2S) protein [Chloroflexota bacterium]MBP7045336.1 Rieske (2Fe-2S) protein [Chloroflexota bacterium]